MDIDNNICRFVSNKHVPDVIQTLHFVYETGLRGEYTPKMATTASIYLVTAGTALVRCGANSKTVNTGDVFFLLPAVDYAINGSPDFCCMYISFIGLRSGMLLERLNICSGNFVFSGFGKLEPFWRSAIQMPSEFADIASESVLLYTLAHIGQKVGQGKEQSVTGLAQKMLLVKKYTDDNFTDPTLNLEKVSKKFSYNKKYLSFAFKKHFQIGFVEYLNTVRVHYACRLIEEKHTSVTDIAYLCGFSDALYFSKVYKRLIGCSPRESIGIQSPKG